MRAIVERDVTANGVRIRVAEVGRGEPLLLLHDVIADGDVWLELARHLGTNHRLIAPDFPGFGRSAKPSASRFPYGIEAFVETITDLFAALGTGRASVIGHGMGALVGASLAARHPELVSELIVINALPSPEVGDVARRLARMPLLGSVVLKQVLGRAGFQLVFRELLGAKPPEQVERSYSLFSSPAARGAALAMLRSTCDSRPFEAHLPRVQAPTLFLWGRWDKVAPASYGRRLARQVPGAWFSLVDAGHCPHEEAPAEVARVIKTFLDKVRSGASSESGY